MVINRRQLISYMAALSVSTVPFYEQNAYKLISAKNIDSKYFIVIDFEHKTTQIPIGFQPHGIILADPNQLIVIGKRPSDLLAVVDIKNQIVTKVIRLTHGRHFWGHGVIDKVTQTLFTTEYDFESETSVISEWGLRDLKHRRTFPSHGISGHDLIIDRNTIICANGGFLTSPEFNRMILSEKITSDLTVIDKQNQALIATVQPFDDHMSFRHLCQTPDTVFIGLQNKTKHAHKQETIIAALDKSSLKLSKVATQNDDRKGYITSIKNFNNQFIVATSHINDSIYIIDAKNKNLIKVLNAKSPQGIQINQNKIYVTIKSGTLEILNNETKLSALNGHWQNHCLS